MDPRWLHQPSDGSYARPSPAAQPQAPHGVRVPVAGSSITAGAPPAASSSSSTAPFLAPTHASPFPSNHPPPPPSAMTSVLLPPPTTRRTTTTTTTTHHAAPGPSLPLPPPAAAPLDAEMPAPASGAARKAGRQQRASSSKGKATSKTQTFLQKLYVALEDPSIHKMMSWSTNGRSILIYRQSELMAHFDKYQIFKQTKWASFTRQLNIYGFKKTFQLGKTLPKGQQVLIWEHETLTRESTQEELTSFKRRVLTDADLAPSPTLEDVSVPERNDEPTSQGPPTSARAPSRSSSRSTSPAEVVAPSPRPSYVRPQPSASASFTRAYPPLSWPSAHPAPSALPLVAPTSDAPRIPPLPSQTSNRSLPSLTAASSSSSSSAYGRPQPYQVPSRPAPRAPQRHASQRVPERASVAASSAGVWADAALLPPYFDAPSAATSSLLLPELNPAPSGRQIMPGPSGFAPPSATGIGGGGGSGALQAPAWESLAGPMTPAKSPPLTIGTSSQDDDDFDFSTPLRSPTNAYFPLNDASGWSTITDDELHASLFHAIDYSGFSTSAAPHVGSSQSLPLPGGHGHPRDYLSPHPSAAQPQPKPVAPLEPGYSSTYDYFQPYGGP